ncbi:ATP-binding cassette domain-containing protein [Paenibacillus sp. P25]|nr:ATP-binding cassette domain-containing protein [Paenibacillus sp. P25]
MELPRGSFTVITGRVGGGKTTLVRTLLGLLCRSRRGSPLERRAGGGAGGFLHSTPQRLYAANSAAVQRYAGEQYFAGVAPDRDRLNRAIHSAVLEPDLERLPLGLETVIGPRGVKLSGGQAQRTAAARMFVREAQLLVFDDLSSALDVDTERRLWERLEAQRRGRRVWSCRTARRRWPGRTASS